MVKFVGVRAWPPGEPVIDILTDSHGLVSLNETDFRQLTWRPPADLDIRVEHPRRGLQVTVVLMDISGLNIDLDQPVTRESSQEMGDLEYDLTDDGRAHFGELIAGDLTISVTCASLEVHVMDMDLASPF